MPRKAAIASGNVDAERASAHAYIVFGSRASAVYALQLNMTEASMRSYQHALPMCAPCALHDEHAVPLQHAHGQTPSHDSSMQTRMNVHLASLLDR